MENRPTVADVPYRRRRSPRIERAKSRGTRPRSTEVGDEGERELTTRPTTYRPRAVTVSVPPKSVRSSRTRRAARRMSPHRQALLRWKVGLLLILQQRPRRKSSTVEHRLGPTRSLLLPPRLVSLANTTHSTFGMMEGITAYPLLRPW